MNTVVEPSFIRDKRPATNHREEDSMLAVAYEGNTYIDKTHPRAWSSICDGLSYGICLFQSQNQL